MAQGFISQIQGKLKQINILEKLILVNGLVFIVVAIVKYFNSSVISYFVLPDSFSQLITKPWSLITYGFIHFDGLHFIFNMLWLYVIGRMFLNTFSKEQALTIYVLGLLSGALFFILGYTLLPFYFSKLSILVGASAAIRALLIFMCAYLPNQEIRFFTFNLKLWHLGVAIVIFDVLGVLLKLNMGGNLAHIGGATLGYVYAKQLQNGSDIGKPLSSLWKRLFAVKPSPLKTVYKNKAKVGGFTKGEFSEFNKQKQIDVILDKISKSGYDSLTADEKEFLFRAGK